MNNSISRVWTFASDSNPNIEYETCNTPMEPPLAIAKVGPTALPGTAAGRANTPERWTWALLIYDYIVDSGGPHKLKKEEVELIARAFAALARMDTDFNDTAIPHNQSVMMG